MPPLMHVAIPRPCDATKLNNDGKSRHDHVGRRLLPNRTDFINFSSKEI